MSEFELRALRFDNLLAILALLGLLRALEHRRPDWRVLAAWRRMGGRGPFHPVIMVADEIDADALAAEAEAGVLALADAQVFQKQDGERWSDVDFTEEEYRQLADECLRDLSFGRAEVLAALATDGVTRDGSGRTVQPTPFCMMFGQGKQYFLKRLQPTDKREKGIVPPLARRTDGKCIIRQALFEPWDGQRDPRAGGFRWDPLEDRRYAYQYANPSSDRGKVGTVPGANRLAAVVLPLFPIHPTLKGLAATAFDRDGHHVSWPIWDTPARLAAIRVLLAHPELVAPRPRPARLRPHGVVEVVRARRIRVGRYVNFSRGTALWGTSVGP